MHKLLKNNYRKLSKIIVVLRPGWTVAEVSGESVVTGAACPAVGSVALTLSVAGTNLKMVFVFFGGNID